MRCPSCESETQVIDTRFSEPRNMTYRRRKCLNPECDFRLTTYELDVELIARVVRLAGEAAEALKELLPK